MAEYTAIVKKTVVSFTEVTVKGLSKESVKKIIDENKRTYPYGDVETSYDIEIKKEK